MGESYLMHQAFSTAKDKIAAKLPNFRIKYEQKFIREVKTWTEDQHINWLTEKDGCIIICHPFECDYPPNWDYSSFSIKLKAAAKDKNIGIYPDPEDLDDATFTQVANDKISLQEIE